MKLSHQRILTVVLLVIAAQWMVYFAFRFHTSEVVTHQATLASRRQMESERAAFAARGMHLNQYNGYASYHYGYARLLGGSSPAASGAFEKASLYMPHKADVLRGWAQASLVSREWVPLTEQLHKYFRLVPAPKSETQYFLKVLGQAAMKVPQYGLAQYYLTSAAYAEGLFSPESMGHKVTASLHLNDFRGAAYAHVAIKAFVDKNYYDPYMMIRPEAGFDRTIMLSFLQAIINYNRDDVRSAVALGSLQLQQRQVFAAEGMIREYYDKFADNADIAYLWGNINYELRRAQIAKRAFERHLQLLPESPYRQEIFQKLGVLGRT